MRSRYLAAALAAALGLRPGAAPAEEPTAPAAAGAVAEPQAPGSPATPAAGAAPLAPPPRLDDTFRYEDPQQRHRLRAAGWIGLYLGAQLSFYLAKGSPTAAQYAEKFTPLDKLLHGAWSLDANSLHTNFAGHPVMGAAMHQMARGSRLPVWESALWAVAGSTAWELMEFREMGSLNDLVVTPAAGVALGEPLFQLGAHYDRTPSTTGRTVLAWIVSPWKKIDDWIDGARPDRGDAADVLPWRAWGGPGWAEGEGWERGQLRLGLEWTLLRDPAFGTPGRGARGWVDGEATGLALAAAVGPEGLDDGRLDSWALLAALHARDLGPGPRGADLVAGAGVGFDLRLHAWTKEGPVDALAMAHAPRLRASGRWLAGDLALEALLEASLAFGGVRSFALDGAPGAVPADELPTVQQGYEYHFAVGPAVHPALSLRWGPASLAADLRGDWLWPVLRPDPTPGAHPTARLEERWTEAGLRAAWRFAGGLEIAAVAERRRRWSRAEAVTRSAEERSLAITVGFAEGR